jgi:Ran GTPase-activating protein (RanGAP) involved in mRNA processing and transport
MTVLKVKDELFSDEGTALLCDFFQQQQPHPNNNSQTSSATNHVMALELDDLPEQQVRRLMQSLHTNTSVKEVDLCCPCIPESRGLGFFGLWIGTLLQQRNDLTSLRFRYCTFRIEDILPGLCRRHAHLQTLGLGSCDMEDEGLRMILEALRDGDCPVMKDLQLYDNILTSVGLRSLTEICPVALPNLHKLDLGSNQQGYP